MSVTRRLYALLAALSSLAMLAVAGGANLKGW